MTNAQNPGNGRWTFSTFQTLDAKCVIASSVAGVSGVLTFDTYNRYSKGTATGDFDITWGSGSDRTTGTFTASYCDLPNGFPVSPTCTQQQ